MEIFIFDKTLESGITLIDQQHKKILEIANMFFVCFENGHADKMAAKAIKFLEEYILYHFSAEEAFQSGCGYPKYREHQADHNYLGTQVKFHSINLKDSNFSRVAVNSFYEFFREWIVNHIMGKDMEFVQYYKEKNALK